MEHIHCTVCKVKCFANEIEKGLKYQVVDNVNTAQLWFYR